MVSRGNTPLTLSTPASKVAPLSCIVAFFSLDDDFKFGWAATGGVKCRLDRRTQALLDVALPALVGHDHGYTPQLVMEQFAGLEPLAENGGSQTGLQRILGSLPDVDIGRLSARERSQLGRGRDQSDASRLADLQQGPRGS